MPDDKPKRFCNVSPEHRGKLHAFRADKYWSEWLGTLHPLTHRTYESSLFALMEPMNITPTQLIDQVASDDRVTRRQLSKQVKIILAQFKERYSWQARNSMKAALKSLLDLNELDLPLIGLKISGQRPVKPYISSTDAERIISRTAVEYQPAFRFMLWSALETLRANVESVVKGPKPISFDSNASLLNSVVKWMATLSIDVCSRFGSFVLSNV